MLFIDPLADGSGTRAAAYGRPRNCANASGAVLRRAANALIWVIFQNWVDQKAIDIQLPFERRINVS